MVQISETVEHEIWLMAQIYELKKKKKNQPWGADTWNLIIEGDFDYIELAILPVGLHK